MHSIPPHNHKRGFTQTEQTIPENTTPSTLPSLNIHDSKRQKHNQNIVSSTDTNSNQTSFPLQEQRVQTFDPTTIFTTKFSESMKKFRERIDALSNVKTCIICNESYTGMSVRKNTTQTICSRCFTEKGVHRFSLENNLDPGKQPNVLTKLSQVEEMLIARVTPILLVTHARGGQYKYSGHTISFPQDISMISHLLPSR